VSETPSSSRAVFFSLRWKIVALCAVSMMLVATAIAGTLVVQARSALLLQLRERGEGISRQLSQVLAYSAFARETAMLRSTAENVARESREVVYVVFRDPSGAVLAGAASGGSALDPAAVPPAPAFAADGGRAERELDVAGVPVVEVTERISYSEPGADARAVASGTVQVGVRADVLRLQVARMTERSLLAALAALVVCLVTAYVLARMVTRPLERLTRAAAGVASGDLRQHVSVRGNDEIAALAGSFQSMSEGLRAMAADLQKAAIEVDGEAGKILTTATQQAAMSVQQASAITETSTTVTEIAQTAKQATEHADSVIHIAQKSEDLSVEGLRALEQANLGIEKLGEQVKAIALTITKLSERTLQIGEIISTVKDVAEQSNILALNAAIEASKAGEHGRGFAVVATEMRNLAEQSKLAASQVRAIVAEVQAGTRAAVDATEEGGKRASAALALAKGAGDAIVGLADVIRESSLAARQIANNTRQQTIGVEQIVSAIAELSGAMNESVEGTRNIESVTANLSTVSKRITTVLTRYQV
jgi:methyl-accepting chemotaxis protein